VSLELGVADVRIDAGDRDDTVVEVRPSNPEKKADVTAAEQTRVEYANGRLLVKAPKGWRQYSWRSEGDSIDVEISLPAGSRVEGDAGVAALHSTGRIGELRFKTGVGEIHLDRAGPVEIRTGAGDVSVEEASGQAQIRTGSGALQVGSVDGPAVVKNSNGDTWLGEVAGDLRVNAGNGKIAVDRSEGSIVAKSANGDILIGTVARGPVVAETAFGKVDIGVVDGVVAWLELKTGHGRVHNELDSAESPAPDEDAVEIRARTSYGDITIRRAGGNQNDANERKGS
jgi:DUF4097 and DUF4098 domain-containing protein YvlB